MKKLFFIAVILFNAIIIKAQVNWLTLEEANKLQDSVPKTILMDMYTDWCGWCKKMDAETFSNPDIAQYINQNFYPVKFNAETTDTIEYKGNTYINEQNGNRSTHKLAQMLMNGRMSYPTVVYIDYEGTINAVPGFMTAENIEPLLIYFTERINKQCSWEEYSDCFNTAFHPEKDTTFVEGNVNWQEFNTTVEKMKQSPKKLLLFIYSDWNSSSKIMSGGAFKDKALTDYINKNFYAVKIPYDIADTLKIAGRVFVNESQKPQYPNQLVLSLLHPDYRIPAITFFDENCNLLFTHRGFSSHKMIEKLANFFGEDEYKKEGADINKFVQNFQSKIK